MSHCGLAIYSKKYLKAKEELWKLKYFTMQKYNLQKNPLKETKILQDIITLELISSFNTSQNIIFQKSSYKKRPIIYQGILATILCSESKHNARPTKMKKMKMQTQRWIHCKNGRFDKCRRWDQWEETVLQTRLAAYWGGSIVISGFRWGFCKGRRSVGLEGIGKS